MPSLADPLIAWYERSHRDLPWRRTEDPYRILVSEVMLQQTRSETATPYFERFLARFPDAPALARASESDVLALWSGLGYYSRARNLRKAAAEIALKGAFPRTFDEMRALPGVGDYTAAAVASIAFGLPHAVLDGNVLRVMARLDNDASDIGSPKTRRRFQERAGQMLDPRRAGQFNQAMMELGATVCLPRAPKCLLCPVAGFCAARANGTAGQLPVKVRKAVTGVVEESVAVVERAGRILMRQRPHDARRMAGFWELPPLETIPGLTAIAPAGDFKHTIVNQRFEVKVYRAKLRAAPKEMRWIRRSELAGIPVTTISIKALSACD